ncbi:GtrA family protein [Streptomyces milbemycinicus]|uniref:GtrA family protein n=1 Tax=Streptomyces milbemycinicus TaxID=476552 RepID=A0ABW8LVQ0_9ACTN
MQRFGTFSDRTSDRDPSERVGNTRKRKGMFFRTRSMSGPLAALSGLVLRFAVVGVGGVLVNTVSLFALYRWAHWPLLAASPVAVELAVVHNYLLNDRWTFAVSTPSFRRFLKFNVSVLGGLAVNVLAVWLLERLGIHLLLANGIGIAAAFAANFAASAGWVWGRRSR